MRGHSSSGRGAVAQEVKKERRRILGHLEREETGNVLTEIQELGGAEEREQEEVLRNGRRVLGEDKRESYGGWRGEVWGEKSL